ncbi:MAG TPA: cellulase family glycosylhydrolase [Nitrososphaeraceae archaeon]|nr:cellulase family glycosylhydrolase [Nitrososphaeraceae archaeon]
MELSKSGSKTSWFWVFQIAVGGLCLLLSGVILASGIDTKAGTAGAYIWLFLAGIGLILLGAERLVSGIFAKGVKRSTRLINIGVGVGLIIYIGSGFFFPEFATKWLVIFLGFGLLANGIIRIVGGLKKKEKEESYDISSVALGVLITSLAILVLAYPPLGIALLVVMTIIALAISGIQIILAGLRGRRKGRQGIVTLTKASVDEQESSAEFRKGIWKSGSWFRDQENRYVLFRGVNFGSRSKMPPYLPIAPLEVHELSQLDLNKEIESVRSGLDLMKNLGFNIIRLLVSWKAIEPRPNANLDELLPEGKKYLEYMKVIIDELYARNLYVILDFHQDIANEVYGGDGFPDWAVAIDEDHEKPKTPTKPDKKWQFKYMISKSLKETLKSFWENDLTNLDEGLKNYPVRTHLEKTIGQTVKFFKSSNGGLGHPGILAVEPFNEPHPNTIPKKEFEVKNLMDYYRNVNSEIEKFDKALFIFIEPRVDWIMPTDTGGMPAKYGASPLEVKSTFGMDFIKNVMVDKKLVTKRLETYLPSDLSSISRFGKNGVLSFHYYDTMAVASSFVKIPESLYTYKIEFPMLFAQLYQAATERGLIPFITEFGAFQEAEQVREYLDLQYKQIEALLLNATIWNYDLYNTEEGKDNWNYENYSLLGPGRKPRNVDAVARPYPMRSSAEPTMIFFDIDSKYASIILKGKVLTDEPTIVYIPFEIHYSPEFTVWSTSNEMKWDKMNNILYWYPSKDQDYNQLVIGKGKLDKLETKFLPEPSKDLAGKTVFTNTFG